MFRSPDVCIPLDYSVKSKHFSIIHYTTNFKLPGNSRNFSKLPNYIMPTRWEVVSLKRNNEISVN